MYKKQSQLLESISTRANPTVKQKRSHGPAHYSVLLTFSLHTHTQIHRLYTCAQINTNSSWNANLRTRTPWSWRLPHVFAVRSSNWTLGSELELCGLNSWTRRPGRRRAAGSGSSVRTPWARPRPATRWEQPPAGSCVAGCPGAAERPQRCRLRRAASTQRSTAPGRWWSGRLAASASGPPAAPESTWLLSRSNTPARRCRVSPDPLPRAAGGRLRPREERCAPGRSAGTEWPLLLLPGSWQISGQAPPAGLQATRHLRGERVEDVQ